MQKLLTFFSKNISICSISNDQSFKDMLTNDIVSFEQLGPGNNASSKLKICIMVSRSSLGTTLVPN